MKRIFIVGSTGQDGRILSKRLQSEGNQVIGISKTSVHDSMALDINCLHEVKQIVREYCPHEIYYLAAFHHSSQEDASNTLELLERSHQIHVRGLIHFLEAIRYNSPQTRLFYAASSLIFGNPAEKMQDENTPFNPCCAYGITKTAGVHCCRLYRQRHGVYASTGILYTHESPYRQKKFVSQKIIQGAIDIYTGKESKLVLGNLSAALDWGYAPDFVDAMTRILKLDRPDDFIVSTGETHTVQEFVELVFGLLQLDWKKYVQEDPALLGRRNAPLIGDSSKLRRLTGWKPTVTFAEMVEILLNHQLNVS